MGGFLDASVADERGARESQLLRLVGIWGFHPYTARQLAAYLPVAGGDRVEIVALGKEHRERL